MYNQRQQSRRTARLFHQWHRRTGISAALFIVWIVASGWLLNHTDSLGMAKTELRNKTLAHWYGLEVNTPSSIFAAGQHWITNSNTDTLILDGQLLENIKLTAIGFTASKNMLAIASPDTLALLTDEGDIIDTLDSTSLPVTPLTRLGSGCNGIAIGDNRQVFASNDGIDWQPCNSAVIWSNQQAIDNTQRESVEQWLVPPVSLEKLVLDLHSGRFFGQYGPYVVDIIAAALMFLALSGLWMFFRSNHLQKQRQKAHKPSRNNHR